VGAVEQSVSDNSVLIFTVDPDTLPSATLPPVARIVDPSTSAPGVGSIPAAVIGQRYLITENTYSNTSPWGVTAVQDDIIEFNGAAWIVVFNSQVVTTTEYLFNTFTGRQYKWTGNMWISTYEGEYMPGYFKLVL